VLLLSLAAPTTADEFEEFERKANATSIWCQYQGDYFGSYMDRQIHLWTHDGETLEMNGQVVKSDLVQKKGDSVIVDFGKLIEKSDLFDSNAQVPSFFRVKFFVNFGTKLSLLEIGDLLTVRAKCRDA
jgi:hypothetical protein